MSAPTIRELTQADRSALMGVLRSDNTFTEEEVAVAMELIDDGLKPGGSADYWFRLAVEEHAVLGYICYGPTPMTRSTYDLYWIVVSGAARGKGVAGSLIEAMESDLRGRGATAVRVETSQTESYGAARRLYEKLKYPEAARLPDFYKPGDALITYYKTL